MRGSHGFRRESRSPFGRKRSGIAKKAFTTVIDSAYTEEFTLVGPQSTYLHRVDAVHCDLEFGCWPVLCGRQPGADPLLPATVAGTRLCITNHSFEYGVLLCRNSKSAPSRSARLSITNERNKTQGREMNIHSQEKVPRKGPRKGVRIYCDMPMSQRARKGARKGCQDPL
jgi:hypothetical protein